MLARGLILLVVFNSRGVTSLEFRPQSALGVTVARVHGVTAASRSRRLAAPPSATALLASVADDDDSVVKVDGRRRRVARRVNAAATRAVSRRDTIERDCRRAYLVSLYGMLVSVFYIAAGKGYVSVDHPQVSHAIARAPGMQIAQAAVLVQSCFLLSAEAIRSVARYDTFLPRGSFSQMTLVGAATLNVFLFLTASTPLHLHHAAHSAFALQAFAVVPLMLAQRTRQTYRDICAQQQQQQQPRASPPALGPDDDPRGGPGRRRLRVALATSPYAQSLLLSQMLTTGVASCTALGFVVFRSSPPLVTGVLEAVLLACFTFMQLQDDYVILSDVTADLSFPSTVVAD